MNRTALGIIAIFMWSFTTLLLAWLKSIPVFETLFIAFFTGFAVLTIAQIYNREEIISHWRQPLRSYLFWLAGPGIYTIMLYAALKLSPIFEATTLNYLWPILLVILSSFLNKQPLKLSAILGVIIGFIGMLLVITPKDAISFNGLQIGEILAIACGFLWALYSTLAKKQSYPAGFLPAAFCVFSIICLALHIALEKTVWPNTFETLILLLLGFTRISYSFRDQAMKKGDVVLLASLSYFLPLITTLWLMAFGFGPHRPMIALGGAFIILGCLSVSFEHIKKLFKRKIIIA